jgi:hypothetical protein
MSTSEIVKQMALERFQMEQAERKAAEEKVARERAAAAAALLQAEKEARLRILQEREEARLRAERALAEEEAARAAAALEAEVEAELERIRNRSPLEVMMEEMARMRDELEALKRGAAEAPTIHLKKDGGLDMRFKTSRNTLTIQATNANLGCDPHVGCGKVLRVGYTIGGCPQVLTAEAEEHATLSIAGPGLRLISATWFTNPNRGRKECLSADVLPVVLGYIREEA